MLIACSVFPQNLKYWSYLPDNYDSLSLSPAVSWALLAVCAKNLTDTLGLDYCLGLHAISHFPV